MVFQSGVLGFAYPRRNPNPEVKFVGALLPYKAAIATTFSQPEKFDQYRPVVLISQGTVEKDSSKLIVPALEALKDTGALNTPWRASAARVRRRSLKERSECEASRSASGVDWRAAGEVQMRIPAWSGRDPSLRSG